MTKRVCFSRFDFGNANLFFFLFFISPKLDSMYVSFELSLALWATENQLRNLKKFLTVIQSPTTPFYHYTTNADCPRPAHTFPQDKREELSARVRSSQTRVCICFVYKAGIRFFFSQDKRVRIILHVCPGKKVRARSGTMGICSVVVKRSSWGLITVRIYLF